MDWAGVNVKTVLNSLIKGLSGSLSPKMGSDNSLWVKMTISQKDQNFPLQKISQKGNLCLGTFFRNYFQSHSGHPIVPWHNLCLAQFPPRHNFCPGTISAKHKLCLGTISARAQFPPGHNFCPGTISALAQFVPGHNLCLGRNCA